ncbi:MAG: hypothetical protein Kow0092_23030 [Deferrisomatales bacterium]
MERAPSVGRWTRLCGGVSGRLPYGSKPTVSSGVAPFGLDKPRVLRPVEKEKRDFCGNIRTSLDKYRGHGWRSAGGKHKLNIPVASEQTKFYNAPIMGPGALASRERR